MIDGVLFDLDGTLIDTATAERARWLAVRDLIGERLPQVDLDEFERRYRAHTRANRATAVDTGTISYIEYQRDRLRSVLSPWTEPSIQLIEEYAETSNRLMALVRPLPGARALLDDLRARGRAIAVLTNGPSEHQRMKLEASGLADAIDAVAISAELGIAKPDAAAFRQAAAMIGLTVERVAMIGDTPATDIAGAIASGVSVTIWLRRRDEPPPDGAQMVTSLDEVRQALALDRH